MRRWTTATRLARARRFRAARRRSPARTRASPIRVRGQLRRVGLVAACVDGAAPAAPAAARFAYSAVCAGALRLFCVRSGRFSARGSSRRRARRRRRFARAGVRRGSGAGARRWCWCWWRAPAYRARPPRARRPRRGWDVRKRSAADRHAAACPDAPPAPRRVRRAVSSESSMLSVAFSRCSCASRSSVRPMPAFSFSSHELQRHDPDQRERDHRDPDAPCGSADRAAGGQRRCRARRAGRARGRAPTAPRRAPTGSRAGATGRAGPDDAARRTGPETRRGRGGGRAGAAARRPARGGPRRRRRAASRVRLPVV